MIKVLFLILLSSNLAELKAVERVFLDPGIDPLSDEMVNAINSLNTTWKAKRNFVGVSLDYVERLLGVAPDDFSLPEADIQIAEDIPERFDAREAWPYCASISNIPDQGSCGSCWAVAAVGAMSDRICIASGGIDQVELSAQDLLACRTFIGNGCQSGQVTLAWVYWETDGIVTGGAFEGAGCKPYKYAPCNHTTAGLTLPNCSNEIPKRPRCEKKCQPNYPKSYEEDKYYGKTIRSIGGSRRVEKIQTEIMRNGPVEATLILYRDFPSYSSGVYQHHSCERMLEHAVRIIGWGVENGVDYWLVANSWNTYWGDQGYFKIRRGINECGIENKIYFGTPDFSRP